MENKQVIVLGIHRSGTSMVAGMLHHLGVSMGDVLINADKYNPKGYFEDLVFVKINEDILTVAGGSWDVPPSRYQINQVWGTIPKDEIPWKFLEDRRLSVLDRMKGEVSLRNNTNRIWGFKDPRTVLTLEAWMPLLSQPKLIIVYRNFDSIVNSLYNRENTEKTSVGKFVGRVEMLVATYFFRLKDIMRKYPDHFIIQYEYALNNPTLVAMRLANYLEVPCTPEAVGIVDPGIRTF